MSGTRSGSAETVGISTSSRRVPSKWSRSFLAKLSSEFLSSVIARAFYRRMRRRPEDEEGHRRLRNARENPPHPHRQRAFVLQVEHDEKCEEQRDRREQRNRI